jgi:hypothetical protein
VYFVLLAAALAILAGVVVVAMGRGGEIAQSRRDVPVRPPRIRTAADIAMLRLPFGAFGYQEHATDEALDAAARLIAEQDAEIARLREELWRMRTERAADPRPGGKNSSPAAAEATHEAPDPGDDALPSPDPVGGQQWQKP